MPALGTEKFFFAVKETGLCCTSQSFEEEENAMRTYLKFVNPIVAVIILALCVQASLFDDGKFKPEALLSGGLQTYFLAKGLFCSSTLFVLGRLMLLLIDRFERN